MGKADEERGMREHLPVQRPRGVNDASPLATRGLARAALKHQQQTTKAPQAVSVAVRVRPQAGC
eukprot:1702490-Alexandrium_andersonii.AAC.1